MKAKPHNARRIRSVRQSRKVKLPWKANLQKIPHQIFTEVGKLGTDAVKVGCLRKLKVEDIQNGMYRHLDLVWEESQVKYQPSIIPLTQVGRFSRYNREGQEIIYKDLPKQAKSWPVETPNFGDSWKGTHTVWMTKEVYPREFVAPKLVPISIELLGEAVQDQTLVFKFTVEEVLDRRSADFEEQLFFNLNLLQENVGNHGVMSSSATLEDYIRTLYVNWELLPPGDKEETLTRILSISGNTKPETRARIVDRYEFLYSLKPQRFIAGTSEFRRYFGAQFADDLVVFENVDYGNAIYVMFDDWEQLSKKSRTELLSSRTTGFERIAHTKTWKQRLHALIRSELKKRQSSRPRA